MTATVNDTDKTIKFGEFQNTTDLTAVEVTFKMNKGHILKTPANLTSTVNLNNPVNVVVLMNGKTEETYKMTADTPETPEAILGAKVGDVEAASAKTRASRSNGRKAWRSTTWSSRSIWSKAPR